jgi:hypothetical protein
MLEEVPASNYECFDGGFHFGHAGSAIPTRAKVLAHFVVTTACVLSVCKKQ